MTLKHPSKPAIMPDPFEWISIPAGSVQLLRPPYNSAPSIIVEVDSFHIAKYLVTNEQYGVYVRETGRAPEWSPMWEDSRFNHPLQPVIYLRWQEAMLFCQWLSEKAGYLITLPTHAQWQRAAQGDDNRQFPWGNEWDATRCNTEESGLWHTTPVTAYPQGASPYGVMDMIGNTWEWCLTNANAGSNSVDWEITETKLMPESRLFSEEHIICGCGYGNKGQRAYVTTYGAAYIFFAYATGIRLVTQSI